MLHLKKKFKRETFGKTHVWLVVVLRAYCASKIKIYFIKL